MLLAVQLYANTPGDYNSFYRMNKDVNGLSIVYELMRKWDKALSIYKSMGNK